MSVNVRLAAFLRRHGVTSGVRRDGPFSTYTLEAGDEDAAIVWFPAAGDTADSFAPALVRLRAELAGVARVLAVDPPGWGSSPPRDDGGIPGFAESNAWAARLLDGAGERGPVVVAGNSSGGALAIGGAVRSSAVIAGAILVSWPDWRFGDAPTSAVLCPKDAASFDALMRRSWHAPPAMPPFAVDRALDALSRPEFTQYVDSFDVAAWSADLDRYRGPLAYVAGTSDRLVPAAVIDASSRARAGCEARFIADCGHYPHREKTDELVAALSDLAKRFFSSVSPPPDSARGRR